MSTGSKISFERKKKGLTQEELAALTKVTVRTIQRIESGESKPRLFTLKAIAAALEIHFEALLPEEAQKESSVVSSAQVNAPNGSASGAHFMHLFCLSCFSYIVIPYVHFLIPVRILSKNTELPAAVRAFAQKIIRVQVAWVVGFHLSLLLVLVYNILQARYGSRQYVVNYLWVVAVMYFFNASLIVWHLRQSKHLTTTMQPMPVAANGPFTGNCRGNVG